MFNATQLLGALLEGRGTASAPQRLDAAVRDAGTAPGNPFAALLGQGGAGLAGLLGGGAGGGQSASLASMLGGLQGMAQQAFGGTAEAVKANNPVAVGGLGAAAGALFGGGRGAIGGGLLAVLGSLAYSAMAKAGTPAPAVPLATDADALQGDAMLVLRAMIEAMKADGRIDETELDRLVVKLDAAGADEAARDWVRTQLNAPPDLAGLAAAVTSPAQAAQAYGAALLAIEVDTPQERAFLAALARALQLPDAAVARMHQAVALAH